MRRKNSIAGTTRRTARGIVALVALLALTLTGCENLGEPEDPNVALEGVSTVGPNPFTPAVGVDAAVTPPPQAGGTFTGDTVGLFGGTLNEATCDKAQLVAFLEQDPTKAAVWAGVLGITPPEIPMFVDGLTPTILRSDTMVTNHGFANAQATAYTAVLQAGTAVLVDKQGFPVVKCFCGNPLVPAVIQTTVVFTGPQWPTFVENQVTVIVPAQQTVQQFVIVDPSTGTAFQRPAGSAGASDAPTAVPPPPTPVLPAPTSPPVETTSVPATSAPTTAAPPTTSAPPAATSAAPTGSPTAAAPPPPATTSPPATSLPPPTTSTPPPTTPPAATPSPSPPATTPPASPSPPAVVPPVTPTTPAPTTPAPTTPASPSPSPAVASWVVGDCFVSAGQAHAVVLLRAEGQAHTFTLRIRLGPQATPIAVDTIEIPATPGQVSQAVVTAPAPSTPDGPIQCAIESIVDENGTPPTAGSPLPPPPSTAPSPTAAPPGQPVTPTPASS